MTTKQSPPRRQPAAGNVLEFRHRHQKYSPSPTKAQVCSNCGTAFDVTPSGHCRTCLVFLLHYLHYKVCRLLHEVQS